MKLRKNICEDCCKGKRISELDEKVDIQGTEYIPFLEGDDNGKFSLGSLKDYFVKLIEEYLINNGIIREDWVQSEPAYKLLATLPELIADRACKDEYGNNINDTYLTREAVKAYVQSIYEDLFTENPPHIMDGYITVDMLSEAVLQLLNSGGAITNFPDDEDITVKDGKLKFKDKVYDPNNYSGIGRTILRKNMVNGVNVLTLEMISEPNIIYIVLYDYDLRGETINVPDNCVLEFEGGSLGNGTLNGSNTIVKSSLRLIFKELNATGTWRINYVYSEWFGAVGDDVTDDSSSIQLAIDFAGLKLTVKLLAKTYRINNTLNVYNHSSIEGSTKLIGYWVSKSLLKQYNNVPVINLKSQNSKEVITGLSLTDLSITYDDSVILDENCAGINIIEDMLTVKGILFKNLFVYNCYYGFKYISYDSINRGYSLNSWEGSYFVRNICGAYFKGLVGTTWINLNSFKDCGFLENKQIGFSLRSFNSAQENEFYSCSFETNGYTNEDDYIGIGAEILSNGGITSFTNCYFENNISKKLRDAYTTYDSTNEDFFKSCNISIIGGTACVKNSVIANSPNFVFLAYRGSSIILENNQYVTSIGDLFCGKIISISNNIVIGNSFLTGIRVNEPLVNSIKGVFNFINNADIRDANIDINVNLSNHKKLLLKYNSLTYFDYEELILDSSSTGDGILGIETDNGFRSLGLLLRNIQKFPKNEIRVKFNSDITEGSYTSQLSNKIITINGNSKTWTISDSAINGSSMFNWDNCNVVINDLNIVFTNTKSSLFFINSTLNSNIVFNNCNFTINTNLNVEFLRGFNKTFNNCTFTGEVTGNFYLNDDFNLKLINTEYPFRIYYSYKGDTSRTPDLDSNDQGYRYFDTTLTNSEYWDGTQWRNEDGTLISKVTII